MAEAGLQLEALEEEGDLWEVDLAVAVAEAAGAASVLAGHTVRLAATALRMGLEPPVAAVVHPSADSALTLAQVHNDSRVRRGKLTAVAGKERHLSAPAEP